MKKFFIIHSYGRTSTQIAMFCSQSLERMNYEVEVFGFNPYKYSSRLNCRLLREYEYAIVVKKIYARILSFSPDCILAIKCDELCPGTVENIKRKFKVPIVNWWIDDPGLIDVSTKISSAYDIFFTNDPDSLEIHNSNGCQRPRFLSFGCFPELHRSLKLCSQEISKYGSDIIFVGVLTKKRADILESLAGFNIQIWSRKMIFDYNPQKNIIEQKKISKESPLRDLIIGREAWGEELIKIYNSTKIILNIHNHGRSDPNMRVFEATACGGLLLTEARRCLGDFFDTNKEILTFKDKKELKEKIEYYLAHQEKGREIALAGQRRVLSNHTYEDRMKEMIEQIKLL